MPNTVTYADIGVQQLTVLPSAARTVDPNTIELRDLGRVSGIAVMIDATAIVSTPSITVKIQGVDVLTGKTWDILTSTAIATAVTTVLKVRPGITPVTNVAVADIIPPIVRIVVSHGNANSITYSVTAHLDRS
jgi:hypothetical protein